MKKYVTLGLGHGLNDCIAGFILGSLFYQDLPILQLGLYTLVYNVLAFGGQWAAAHVVEKRYTPKIYLIGCFVLMALALVSPAPVAIICAGMASAFYHIVGGLEAGNKAFGIGLFAAPGVIGLIGGGWMAWQHIDFTWYGVMGSVALIFAAIWYKPAGVAAVKQEHGVEGHDVLMIVLITVISLRSFIWDVVQLVQKDNYEWLMIIAIAALCGKIAGGWLADRIGHRRYTLYVLILSIPFLTLFKKHLFTLSIGVFLLQSTIPATTVLILQRVKPAMAIAWSFGLSVFIAITVFYTPLVGYLSNNTGIITVLVTSVILFG